MTHSVSCWGSASSRRRDKALRGPIAGEVSQRDHRNASHLLYTPRDALPNASVVLARLVVVAQRAQASLQLSAIMTLEPAFLATVAAATSASRASASWSGRTRYVARECLSLIRSVWPQHSARDGAPQVRRVDGWIGARVHGAFYRRSARGKWKRRVICSTRCLATPRC